MRWLRGGGWDFVRTIATTVEVAYRRFQAQRCEYEHFSIRAPVLAVVNSFGPCIEDASTAAQSMFSDRNRRLYPRCFKQD